MVLFAELHWNPSIISQAEARAHRFGQENQVVVRYLLAPGTADDSIWPMLQEKQRTLTQVGLCKDNFEDVAIKKQNAAGDTHGIDFNVSGNFSPQKDIRVYFTPEKKRKIENSNECADNTVNSAVQNKDDVFDDGLDDALCDLDF